MGVLTEIQLRAATYCISVWELVFNVVRIPVARLTYKQAFNADLAGQKCVITGGNAGIGLATAVEFCRRGCDVTLACRSKAKAEKAIEKIQLQLAAEGKTCTGLHFAELNLSSLKSVRAFSKSLTASAQPVNFLILNAGIMGHDSVRRETEDRFEEHFQVNHLSQWTLAHDLVSHALQKHSLQKSQMPTNLRVVFLSSAVHTAGQLDFQDLQLTKNYSGFRAYTNSKLAGVLSARQLQAFLDRKACDYISATSVHPGMVATQLADGWITGSDAFGGLLQPVVTAFHRALGGLTLEPPSLAVRTILFAAFAATAEVKGQYIAYSKVRKGSKRSRDMHCALQLWNRSLELAQISDREIETS